MISVIMIVIFLIGIFSTSIFISKDCGFASGILGSLTVGMAIIALNFFINWCLLRFLVQETPDTYIETQPVIAQHSILHDSYIVPTSSGSVQIPINRTIIQPSDTAELEIHYLQQEYSDGAKFLCAPFAVDGPVIDYYILKINNS